MLSIDSSSVASLRERVVAGSPNAICDALRAADTLVAAAIESLGRDGAGVVAGLPAEIVLSLDARRTSWEARALVGAAADLRGMPSLSAAFTRGVVSWSHVWPTHHDA